MGAITVHLPPAAGPGPAPEPGSPSSPTPRVPRRDRVLAAVVVLALLAVLAAVAVWRWTRDDASSSAAAPATEAAPEAAPGQSGSTTTTAAPPQSWPVEVQPLVDFVEQHRGGAFDHPVPIHYLADADYQAAASAKSHDMTAQEQQDLENWEGTLRALGLVAPGTDLQAATEQLYGEGTLAFYDPDANEIEVLGTEMDVAHRVTLVHELTHAWQDQHGYLDRLDELDDARAFTLQSLAEGDAMRIQQKYVDSLSTGDRSAYDEQSRQQAAQSDLHGVPDVLVASFSSPYALGGPFAQLLDERGGNGELDKAMSNLPPAEADLVEPARYLDSVEPVEVAEPSVPAGGERLDGGPFGAVSWLLTLSERVDPRQALDVVDRWDGDQSVTYRLDGRICNAAAYRGEFPADTATAADVMASWAAASPGLDATVERVGDDAILRSCEAAAGAPGPAVAGRSQVALQYPALRLQAMVEVLSAGYDLDQATCFGNSVVHGITVEQMQAGVANDPAEGRQLGAAAARACLD